MAYLYIYYYCCSFGTCRCDTVWTRHLVSDSVSKKCIMCTASVYSYGYSGVHGVVYTGRVHVQACTRTSTYPDQYHTQYMTSTIPSL